MNTRDLKVFTREKNGRKREKNKGSNGKEGSEDERKVTEQGGKE